MLIKNRKQWAIVTKWKVYSSKKKKKSLSGIVKSTQGSSLVSEIKALRMQDRIL